VKYFQVISFSAGIVNNNWLFSEEREHMKNKTILLGSIVVLVAAGIFLMLWRTRIMGAGAKMAPGNLVAVNAQGTPIEVPQGVRTAQLRNPGVALQQSEDMIVQIRLDPYPPTMSGSSTFEIILRNTSGTDITNATISLYLTMPGMWMPPNMLDLESQGDGRYVSTGHFTMRGMWRMEVTITLDGKIQSVFFNVWL
jgi:hypothetical protein